MRTWRNGHCCTQWCRRLGYTLGRGGIYWSWRIPHLLVLLRRCSTMASRGGRPVRGRRYSTVLSNTLRCIKEG